MLTQELLLHTVYQLSSAEITNISVFEEEMERHIEREREMHKREDEKKMKKS